tara:strand:- start:11054 stop:11533 length:480 start_codon:yes stop_codon:yes gene_type:complete
MSDSVIASFPRAKLHGKFLLSLPVKIQQNSARKATTFASTPLLKAARDRAPVEFGALKESLIKVNRTYKRAGVVMSLVGKKRGFQRYYRGRKNKEGKPVGDLPSNIIALINFGTSKTKPNRFMHRAFVSAKPKMKTRFFAKMKRDLPKDIERARRKGAL